MRLVERDYEILREIERWRVCLGRHVRVLAGFSGSRAVDRRLRVLIDGGYIGRRKYIYGVPSIYFLTYKGKMVINASKRQSKIKLEQIVHDIAVLDTVIFLLMKNKVLLKEITSEKELQSQAGFGTRKHFPDFVILRDNSKYCVEVELTLKAKVRFEKIIKENFLGFDKQYWIIPQDNNKIRQILQDNTQLYNNIKIINIEEVQDYVRNSK